MRAAKKAKLPKKDIEKLEGENLQVPAGTRLVTENEFSRKMFVIKSGKVRVWKSYVGQRVTLAILGEGEVFGELSFFDAAPRSASVDALTDLEVLVIDGKQATEQIANLPSWVVPIFKTVFHRFREADQKIAVLESLKEFQKKFMRTDNVAKSVYLELLRFIRTLELLHSRAVKMGPVSKDELMKELDEVLGKRVIGLTTFWKTLRDYDYVDARLEDTKGHVHIQQHSLRNWKTYLSQEVESERFLLLSYSAVAVLRRIVSGLFEQGDAASEPTDRIVPLDHLRLESIPLYKEGLDELSRQKIIRVKDEKISFNPSEVMEVYNYQNLLRSFDHTIISLE